MRTSLILDPTQTNCQTSVKAQRSLFRRSKTSWGTRMRKIFTKSLTYLKNRANNRLDAHPAEIISNSSTNSLQWRSLLLTSGEKTRQASHLKSRQSYWINLSSWASCSHLQYLERSRLKNSTKLRSLFSQTLLMGRYCLHKAVLWWVMSPSSRCPSSPLGITISRLYKNIAFYKTRC